MRYFILAWLVVTASINAATAQQAPKSVSPYVFVQDIEEHKVVISAPFGFGKTRAENQNLYDWADWACQFYHREAVGPLSQTSGTGKGCQALGLLKMAKTKLTPQEAASCPQTFLFACAME